MQLSRDPIQGDIDDASSWLEPLKSAEIPHLVDFHRLAAAVRGALHELRDHLPPAQASELGNELPVLVRGLYYEGWRPAITPRPALDKAEFLARFGESLPELQSTEGRETILTSLFELFGRRISPSQSHVLRHALPRAVSVLWPRSGGETSPPAASAPRRWAGERAWLEKLLERAHEWLYDLMEDLSTESAEDAYVTLKAALQVLRDRIPMDEAVHLGAQLPVVIRGLYYEKWTPDLTPTREHTAEEIQARFRDHAGPELPVPARVGIPAVWNLLVGKLSAGETDKVFACLPREMRRLCEAGTEPFTRGPRPDTVIRDKL